MLAKKKILLFLFPIFLSVMSYEVLNSWVGPYSDDPEYSDLFNSFLILQQKAPYFRDHPGTLTQSIGALGLRALNPTLHHEAIIDETILHSQRAITFLTVLLSSLCALIIGIAGIWMSEVFNNIYLGLLFQLLPFLSFSTWSFFGRFAPESMVVAGSMFTCAALLRFKGKTQAALAGLGFAAVIASKFTGLPIGVFIAFILWRDKSKIPVFLISFLVSFAFFVHPLFWDIEGAYRWYVQMYSRYSMGSGSGSWLNHAASLYIRCPYLLAALAFGAFFFVRGSKSQRLRLVPVFGAVLLQMLLVSGSQTVHYLMPCFTTAALLFVLPLSGLKAKWAAPAALGIASTFACFIAYIIVFNPSYLSSGKYVFSGPEKRVLYEAVENAHCTVISSFSGAFEMDTLLFGNTFSGYVFTGRLLRLLPDEIVLSETGLSFQFSNLGLAPISMEKMKQSGKSFCVAYGRFGHPDEDYLNFFEQNHIRYTRLARTLHEGSVFKVVLP